jgi:hypothetical protein
MVSGVGGAGDGRATQGQQQDEQYTQHGKRPRQW